MRRLAIEWTGNHIPYWDGIVEEWYAYGVHYADFPYKYSGNLVYDLNDYIYNGIWKPELSSELWLDPPK